MQEEKGMEWERSVLLHFVNTSVLVRNFIIAFSMCWKFGKFWLSMLEFFVLKERQSQVIQWM